MGLFILHGPPSIFHVVTPFCYCFLGVDEISDVKWKIPFFGDSSCLFCLSSCSFGEGKIIVEVWIWCSLLHPWLVGSESGGTVVDNMKLGRVFS